MEELYTLVVTINVEMEELILPVRLNYNEMKLMLIEETAYGRPQSSFEKQLKGKPVRGFNHDRVEGGERRIEIVATMDLTEREQFTELG